MPRTFRHNSRASRDLGPVSCWECGELTATKIVDIADVWGDATLFFVCDECLPELLYRCSRRPDLVVTVADGRGATIPGLGVGDSQ